MIVFLKLLRALAVILAVFYTVTIVFNGPIGLLFALLALSITSYIQKKTRGRSLLSNGLRGYLLISTTLVISCANLAWTLMYTRNSGFDSFAGTDDSTRLAMTILIVWLTGFSVMLFAASLRNRNIK